MKEKRRIVIAGATGFVGQALLPKLAEKFTVRALTRGNLPLGNSDNIEWKTCDLFSLLDAEEALQDTDVGIYLVHSMLPSAHLTQGQFQDMDYLAANNFARAARINGLKHIIYLGGIIPPGVALSAHLQSRLEVERVLGGEGIPVTSLRAGLILGSEGSSYTIMTKLVRHLPVMICPLWTATLSEPVSLEDVVIAICHVAERDVTVSESYDLCGGSTVSYKEMMASAARFLGLKRRMWTVPYFTPRLSSLWVQLVTGAPRSLVRPLVESLSYPMTGRDSKRLSIEGWKPLAFEEAMKKALASRTPPRPRAFVLPEEERRKHTVRSVQRLEKPSDMNAEMIRALYLTWLQSAWFPFFRVSQVGEQFSIGLRGISTPLLVLERSSKRSSPDRSLLYIVGGLLVRPSSRARLEFREMQTPNEFLVAVHDYEPSLPWWIYVWTQALVHLFVMRRFGSYIKSASFSKPAAAL